MLASLALFLFIATTLSAVLPIPGPIGTAGAVELVADDGLSFTPSCRCGNAPLLLSLSLQLNGRLPFAIEFDWGDSSTDEIVTLERTLTQSHTYSSAGNYSLVIELTDDASAFRRLVYVVHVYAPPFAGVGALDVLVEGHPNGSIPLLFAQADTTRHITWIVRNIGDATLDRIEWVLSWRLNAANCWGGFTSTMDVRIAILPGAYVWASGAISTGSSGDTIQECISVFSPSAASPTLNFTAEYEVEVVDGLAQTLPTVSASLIPSSLGIDVGAVGLFTLTLENTGIYAERIDTVLIGVDPSISVIPSNPGNWGTLNGSFRYATTIQRLYLVPGEIVSIPVSVQGTKAIEDDLTFGVNPQRMSLAVDTVGPTATTFAAIEITEVSGGLVSTLSARVTTPTRVELSGKILSLAAAPFIDVWFQVRTVDTVSWLIFPATPIRISTSNTIVERTVALTAATDYQFEFVGQTSSGALVFGGIVAFRTVVTDEPQGDFSGVLGILESLSGYKAEVWGLIFGAPILIGAVWVMNSDRFIKRQVPWTIQLLVIIVLVLINVWLLLWHVGILLAIAVIGGALWVQAIRQERGGGD